MVSPLLAKAAPSGREIVSVTPGTGGLDLCGLQGTAPECAGIRHAWTPGLGSCAWWFSPAQITVAVDGVSLRPAGHAHQCV